MCYPKPGPRCSGHARAKLRDAKRAYDRSVATQDFQSFEPARDAYHKAIIEYQTTPAGIKELKEKAASAPPEKATEAIARFEKATKEREEAMVAYKKAFDAGRVTSPIMPEDKAYTQVAAAADAETKLAQAKDDLRHRAAKAIMARGQVETDRQNRRRTWAEETNLLPAMVAEDISEARKQLTSYFAERRPQLAALETELSEVRKQRRALREMMNSATDPAEQERVRSLNKKLLDKTDQLMYEINLVNTSPEKGDHPQTIADREQVLKRFSLMDSIQGLLR